MGAWGFGAFDNDDAGDWLEELEESEDTTFIADTLDRVVSFEDDLEATDASRAVAAAEIVAALRGRPPADFDEMAKDWVKANRSLNVADLVQPALAALQRVRTASELKDLWDESKEAAQWYAALDDIAGRLEGKRDKG